MTTDDKINIRRTLHVSTHPTAPVRSSANAAGKDELLDAMEKVTDLHRKHLIHLMQQDSIQRHPRSRERDREDGPAVDAVLARVWEVQDYICAERLQSVLVFTAEQLAEPVPLR
jgi:hypothetical protein